MNMGRLAAAIAVVVAWAVLLIQPAQAHAVYKDSDPADESTVSSAPSSVWAEFSEPPADGASTLQIFDPCGAQVDLGDSSSSGYRTTVSMNGVIAGEYTVRFHVVSGLDGHETTGDFTFTATEGDPCNGDEGSGTSSKPKRSTTSKGTAPGTTDASPAQDDDGGLPVADSQTGSSSSGGHSHHHVHESHSAHHRHKREAGAGPGDLAAANVPLEKAPGILSDMPIGGLILALSMAALVGCAGGKIYAGIMGPRG
jgi:methionine-rich copper-binding protein CopC